MINHKLEMALVMAIREAKTRRHEHVTVEHILYADRKSTRLNYSHVALYRMPSSAWKKKGVQFLTHYLW